MAYEQKDNSGSIFKNDRKEQPNHPDYKGSAMIDGREFWISVWLKNVNVQGKKPFMSLAFQPKDEQGQRAPAQSGQQYEDDPSDSIPF